MSDHHIQLGLFIVGVVGLLGLFIYCIETWKLRIAAEKQIEISQNLIAAAVDQDPVEPRVEAIGVAQAVKRLPSGDCGVLNGILPFDVAPEKHGRESIRAAQMGVSQTRECGFPT